MQVKAQSGYRYLFNGKRRWRASSSEYWEIVCRGESSGKLLGRREIDGSECIVWREPSGEIFAILAHVATVTQ